eukprot:3103456-Alexandrium_andersonii.AAC.1
MSGVCCSSNFHIWGVICCSSTSPIAPPARPPREHTPSRASVAHVEAAPGPAQFRLRTSEAVLRRPMLLEHEPPDIRTCLNLARQ